MKVKQKVETGEEIRAFDFAMKVLMDDKGMTPFDKVVKFRPAVNKITDIGKLKELLELADFKKVEGITPPRLREIKLERVQDINGRIRELQLQDPSKPILDLRSHGIRNEMELLGEK